MEKNYENIVISNKGILTLLIFAFLLILTLINKLRVSNGPQVDKMYDDVMIIEWVVPLFFFWIQVQDTCMS